MLTVICGEAGCSIRTTEGTDWAESKWQWRHLCGEKNLQCFKKGEQQKEKEISSVIATEMREHKKMYVQ